MMADNEPIDTEAAFQSQLTRIVNEAASNGIDVEGAWPVLNDDPDVQDWDLQIFELAKSDTSA